MTFDEAIKYAKENSFVEEMLSDVVELEDVIEILEKLKKEYAPTVEMTKNQHHNFKLWKYHTAGWNMTNCAEWARDEDITANSAMRAWLHPETIKIIGDENE